MAVSFDRIAGIYDSTRWTGVPVEIVKKLLSAFGEAVQDCQSILDVGVGTGRFAEFFDDAGFFVVGIDISLSMMAKAREKGVRDLVRADAHYLPFKDRSFDGSIMIHLLHLARDWREVVREVGRVTGKIVVSEVGDSEGFSPRDRYLELRTEMGYPLNRLNDAEPGLKRILQPKFVISVGDYWVEFDADVEISEFEKRSSSVTWDVPVNVHKAIILRLHDENRGKRLRRWEKMEVAGWDPEQFRSIGR